MSSIVQYKRVNTAGATPVSVTLDATPTPGNVLVAIANSATTLTGPAGWTSRANYLDDQAACVWDKAVAEGQSATVTITPNGSFATALTVIELEGVQFDALAAMSRLTNVSSATLPSVAAAAAGILISFVAMHGVTDATMETLDNAWTNGVTGLARNDFVYPGSADSTWQAIGSKAISGPGAVGASTVDWATATGNLGQAVVGWQLAYKNFTAPVVASAGADQSVVFTDGVVSLSASATGGEGSRTYAWTKVSGPAGTFGTAGLANTTFTASGLGTYVLRVTVTDSNGSSTDDVTVTLTPATVLLPVTVTGATNWTLVGAANNGAALSDSSDSSYLESQNNPTGQVLTLRLPSMPKPEQDLVLEVDLSAPGTTSRTVLARIKNGGTTLATVTVPLTTINVARYEVAFPYASLASVPMATWEAGTLTVELVATAA